MIALKSIACRQTGSAFYNFIYHSILVKTVTFGVYHNATDLLDPTSLTPCTNNEIPRDSLFQVL